LVVVQNNARIFEIEEHARRVTDPSALILGALRGT